VLVIEELADEDSRRADIELIEWFSRHYPTAKERLAYVRRKYAEVIALRAR
jgi:hypothetical protein